MNTKRIKANILLFLAAIIWGFSFTAQRAGMQHIGPYTFNAIRFLLGSISLIPFIFIFKNREKNDFLKTNWKTNLWAPVLTGTVLFIASSLQQIGILTTTAGKAGFITGLYVIIVPIIGLFLKHKTNFATWLGAGFALLGMYLLSVTGNFEISQGDLLVFFSAFFWAMHVLLVDSLVQKVNGILLACLQFFVCSILSFGFAFAQETFIYANIMLAAIPILYAGIMSVGVAFTLQIIAQRDAAPSHVALILSLEAVFAALGGWLILAESLTTRGIIGCGMMLVGMMISQLFPPK